jgi:SnoaL-like domain
MSESDSAGDGYRGEHAVGLRSQRAVLRVLNIAVHPGEMDRAATRSHCDAILIRRGAAGGDVLQVWGVYTDRVARTTAGWRIVAREFRAVGYRGALAVLGEDTHRVARGFGDALPIDSPRPTTGAGGSGRGKA